MGLGSSYVTHSKRLPIHLTGGGHIVLTLIAPQLPQATRQLHLCTSPIATGVAQDGIGWWVVQLFCNVNFWRISPVAPGVR
jgi:hypothetical protein